ncbi:hypothetical protein BC936DRAFT_141546, partial [Jimgerdemannia flammicorona]
MGTRGLYCIRHNGKYYIYYNHFDSYPSYTGVRLLARLWTQDLGVWRNLLDKIIILDDVNLPPITPDVIKKIRSINPAKKDKTGGCYIGISLLQRWKYLLAQDLHDDDMAISNVISYWLHYLLRGIKPGSRARVRPVYRMGVYYRFGCRFLQDQSIRDTPYRVQDRGASNRWVVRGGDLLPE